MQQRLVEQLRAIGIQAGDTLMIHASLRKVGHVEGGADGLIDALRGSVGSSGTLFAYADFEATPAMPHFDAARSPCATDHGVFPEVLRLRAGTLRSLNPGASVLALGAKAGTLTHPHPLKYGYGVGTPFARFVASGGKVLLLGSPFDTVSLLHYAEDIANLPSKRVLRYTVPVQVDGSIRDVEIEEFDTSHPVVTGMPENYFEQVVQAFVVSRELQPRLIGAAASYLIDAQPLVQEAKERMEREYGN